MMDEAVIAIMIEKKGAIDNLEEILAVKGVDMVQFGPVLIIPDTNDRETGSNAIAGSPEGP